MKYQLFAVLVILFPSGVSAECDVEDCAARVLRKVKEPFDKKREEKSREFTREYIERDCAKNKSENKCAKLRAELNKYKPIDFVRINKSDCNKVATCKDDMRCADSYVELLQKFMKCDSETHWNGGECFFNPQCEVGTAQENPQGP